MEPIHEPLDLQSAWEWLQGRHSAPESARRAAVVWRACERLLKLEPRQRPRSLKSFCTMFRHRAAVRSFTVDPQKLAIAVGRERLKLPDLLAWQAPCRPEMVEGPTEEMVSLARARLSKTPCDDSCSAVGHWHMSTLASIAVVQQSYSPTEVASVLCGLALIRLDGEGRLDCESLNRDACVAALPAVVSFPREPWKFKVAGCNNLRYRSVIVPTGCMAGFIGPGGSIIGSLRAELQRQVDYNFPVRLRLQSCVGGGGVARISVPPHTSTDRLDSMRKVVEVCINEVGVSHKKELRHRRNRRIQFEEEAQAYHRQLRRTYAARRQQSWAERALTVPGTDVSGIGQEYIRRGRGAHLEKPGHLRRRSWLKEKRRNLLRFAAGVVNKVPRHLGAAAAQTTGDKLPRALSPLSLRAAAQITGDKPPKALSPLSLWKDVSLRTKRGRADRAAVAFSDLREACESNRPGASSGAQEGIEADKSSEVFNDEQMHENADVGRSVAIAEDGFNTQITVIHKEKGKKDIKQKQFTKKKEEIPQGPKGAE